MRMLKFPEPAQPTPPPRIALYQVPCGICGVRFLADTEGAALKKWARHRIAKHESWRGTPTDHNVA